MKQITRVRIEPMALPDLPRVREIEGEAFAAPWPKDAYRAEIQDNQVACYLVARDDDGVAVGFAGMWVIFDEAHVTTIAVDRYRRGQRIGHRLVLALIEHALARGARWMTLEVRPSNGLAMAVYRKFGFREVALRKRYYSDNGEDAAVMWSGNLREPESQARLDAIRRDLDS
ncbi:MAG: ribosomal-protein-alanine N-acetyltransferase [Armatimonadetes bacterium RBG_16_67_12]|nr:MAG: ribosomal-protein-alanine N-acetyltransferase [Armatimonadetes bacterium RBG_16_67_12]